MLMMVEFGADEERAAAMACELKADGKVEVLGRLIIIGLWGLGLKAC